VNYCAVKTIIWLGAAGLGVVGVLVPLASLAHRSGCHTLHTCASDTNQYECGDLGYPCDGSSSINDIDPADIVVPLLVKGTFKQVFERTPSDAESVYWKARFRSDKGSAYKIKRAMRWHEARGSFGPKTVTATTVIEPISMVRNINAFFRAVYEREPSRVENVYWLSRIKDKPTKQEMKDAMSYHKMNGIEH